MMKSKAPKPSPIKVTVKLNISLWNAIKLRIAGNGFKEDITKFLDNCLKGEQK